MPASVDAVIAALRVVLQDAEERPTDYHWKTSLVNRWINVLPGAWRGRWWNLRLRGGLRGEVSREDFILHVRASLAYLELHRQSTRSKRGWSWRLTRTTGTTIAKPIEAQFQEVDEGLNKERGAASRVKLIR